MEFLFNSLGLDSKEKQIYLKLLSLGACPVSMLAKKMVMPRSSLYVVVDRLKEIEVIEVFQNHGKTFIRAAEVNKLKEILEKKARRLKHAMKELEENVGVFEAAQKKETVMPKVNFYEGSKQLKKFYKIWARGTNYRSFFDTSIINKDVSKHWANTKNQYKDGEFIKEIWFDSPQARAFKETIKEPEHQVKFLRTEAKVKADMMIFEDKIYLTSYKDQEVVGVTEIADPHIAAYLILFFDELWNRLD